VQNVIRCCVMRDGGEMCVMWCDDVPMARMMKGEKCGWMKRVKTDVCVMKCCV